MFQGQVLIDLLRQSHLSELRLQAISRILQCSALLHLPLVSTQIFTQNSSIQSPVPTFDDSAVHVLYSKAVFKTIQASQTVAFLLKTATIALGENTPDSVPETIGPSLAIPFFYIQHAHLLFLGRFLLNSSGASRPFLLIDWLISRQINSFSSLWELFYSQPRDSQCIILNQAEEATSKIKTIHSSVLL